MDVDRLHYGHFSGGNNFHRKSKEKQKEISPLDVHTHDVSGGLVFREYLLQRLPTMPKFLFYHR